MERPDAFSDEVRGKLEGALEMKATKVCRGAAFSGAVSPRDWNTLWQRVMCLRAPTAGIPAAPITDRPEDYGKLSWKNTGIFDFTGQPSISIPCGFTQSGLPVGLMITGRRFEDRRVLQFASAFRAGDGVASETAGPLNHRLLQSGSRSPRRPPACAMAPAQSSACPGSRRCTKCRIHPYRSMYGHHSTARVGVHVSKFRDKPVADDLDCTAPLLFVGNREIHGLRRGDPRCYWSDQGTRS